MSELVAHQFHDLKQQRETAELGMWVFLATEVLMFGGALTVFLSYRALHPGLFEAGARSLDWRIGAANTAILIASSLAMALGVRFAKGSAKRASIASLGMTALLGSAFLVLKGVEYLGKWHHGEVPGRHYHGPPGQELFFTMYFALTGLHALHMVIGIAVVAVLLVKAWRGTVLGERYLQVEVAGLYWHLVDIVWIFLFPLLYLSGGIQLG